MTSGTGNDRDGAQVDEYGPALDAAQRYAMEWLDSVHERPIRPDLVVDDMLERLVPILPEEGLAADEVIDELAAAAGPGLMAMGSPRFYGFVIGGAYPAALAADWLVSAWDQNTGSRQPTPATAAVEETAARWLLELLGLPTGSGVGFATGATSANFACLLAARDAVIRERGADPALGLQQAPH